MRRILPLWCMSIAGLVVFLANGEALATSGVHDQAHYFSDSAISQAEEIIRQVNHRHNKDVLFETLPSVPEDLRSELEVKGKEKFFEDWADQRFRQQGVNGVYVLVCKDPSHLEAAVGSNTAQHLFTIDDRTRLVRGMVDYFKKKDFDGGLLHGVQFIEKQMDAHEPNRNAGAAQSKSTPPAVYPPVQGPGNGNVRTGWGIGGIACLIIGVILFIILIRGIFGRSGSRYYGGPGGYGPPGGSYPPGGYPPPGGYGYGGYGGGGGFGRGFLGGLLGGALGGWAVNKWEQNQQGGFLPPASGQDYSSGVDTSASSSGGDFGSSDDASAGGGDFGSSDSGGGSDFGGGGDFSGGGGDFGGGGDSGSSGGGDF